MLFDHDINGILADEMGLGKTVQVIALICHLIEKNVMGPFLIVAPLSTIPNWKSEFERFAPKVPFVVLHGKEHERTEQRRIFRGKHDIDGKPFKPVVITTYHVVITELKFLKQHTWKYVIVDEGQRIKNHNTRLAM